MIIKSGFIHDIQIKGEQFIAKIEGLQQACEKEIGELYSPLCRAKFGDNRCKVCKQSYTYSGAIIEVISEVKFNDLSRTEPIDYFAFGEIVFESGANTSQVAEVRTSTANMIELMLPLPFLMQVGDKYLITAGCDKQFTTCINKYSNALNFRGEPHIPQPDRLSLW